MGEVIRIRGKKLPLTAAPSALRFPLSTLRSTATEDGSAFPISAFQPALAAETLQLVCTLSDLVNQAYGLTPAEIELMWQTAPYAPPATQLSRNRISG